MPRAPKPAAAAIDPRSAAVVLFFTGGPVPRDVPARDLSGNDLARLAYIRAHVDLESGRPDPATSDELEALATELSSSGAFAREATYKPAQPGKEPA